MPTDRPRSRPATRRQPAIPPLPSRPALLAFIGFLVALGPAPVEAAPRPAGGSTGPWAEGEAAGRPADDAGRQAGEPASTSASTSSGRTAADDGERRMARRPSRGRPRRASPVDPSLSPSAAPESSSRAAQPSAAAAAAASASSSSSPPSAAEGEPTPAPAANRPLRRAAHAIGATTGRALVDKYEVQSEGSWALASEWELYGVKLAAEASSDGSPSATADAAAVETSSSAPHAAASPTTLPPGWGSGSRDEFEVPLIVVISVGLCCIVLATIFTFLARRNKHRRIARRAKRYEEKKLRRAREAAEAADAAAAPSSASLQIPRVPTKSAGDGASVVSSATSSSVASSRNGASARQRLGKTRVVGSLRAAGKNFMRISKGKGRAREDDGGDDDGAGVDGEGSADRDGAADEQLNGVSEGDESRSSPSVALGGLSAGEPSRRRSTYEPTSPGVPGAEGAGDEALVPPSHIIITDTDADPAPAPPPHPSHHPTPPAYHASSSSSSGRPRSSSDPRLAAPLGPLSRQPSRSNTVDVSPTALDENDDEASAPPPALYPPGSAPLPSIPSFPRDAKVPLRPPSPPPAVLLSPARAPTAEASELLARHARHLATDDKAVLARMASEASAPDDDDDDQDGAVEGSAPPVWEAHDSHHDGAPDLGSAPVEPSPESAPARNGSAPPADDGAGTPAFPAPPRQWGRKTLDDPYFETVARAAAAADGVPAPSPSYVPSEPAPPSLLPSAPPDEVQAEAEASAPPLLEDEDAEGNAPTAPAFLDDDDDEPTRPVDSSTGPSS